jgi:hypothetical protein
MPTMRILVAAVTLAAVVGLPACSSKSDSPAASSSTVTVTAAPSSSTAAPAPAGPTTSTPTSTTVDGVACELNPAEQPAPTAPDYQWVPEADRVSVKVAGLPTGTIKPGDAPQVIDVTVCNNSPVSYAGVGFVVVLDHCSCAPGPNSIAAGSVEYFERATGSWKPVRTPSAGLGMDYLSGMNNVQSLPKGLVVKQRFRIALDPSMTAGDGGVTATVVSTNPLNQIGSANLPFTVVP